jgi:hypothetical protein
MPDITFYDGQGSPIAYTEDGEHIYLFSGEPVGYLTEGSVYSYGGGHLGRFENGWVRDNAGAAVFFTDSASGGPMRPLAQLKPLKSLKGLRPLKGLKAMRPLKAADSLSWSALSGGKFFSPPGR